MIPVQKERPLKPKVVDFKIKNTFTIWFYLCKIKWLHKWLINNHWQRIASTCHIYEKREGERVGEHSKIHWYVTEYISN